MENFIFCTVLLTTNENCEKQQCLISLGPLTQKVTPVAPDAPTLI